MLIDAGLRRYVCNGQKPAWQRDGEECLLYPPATDIVSPASQVRKVPQRDENRGKSAIPKRTFRGPGIEIGASRAK
jgi:hypothetical protein